MGRVIEGALMLATYPTTAKSSETGLCSYSEMISYCSNCMYLF